MRLPEKLYPNGVQWILLWSAFALFAWQQYDDISGGPGYFGGWRWWLLRLIPSPAVLAALFGLLFLRASRPSR